MANNTFGRTEKSYHGGKAVWREIRAAFPVGGTISNLEAFELGSVIPAGSMCVYDQVAHTIKIAKAGDDKASVLDHVNGLLRSDIYVDEHAKAASGAATGAVVYAGEIFIDRCAEAVPASVLAQLGQIVSIKEE